MLAGLHYVHSSGVPGMGVEYSQLNYQRLYHWLVHRIKICLIWKYMEVSGWLQCHTWMAESSRCLLWCMCRPACYNAELRSITEDIHIRASIYRYWKCIDVLYPLHVSIQCTGVKYRRRTLSASRLSHEQFWCDLARCNWADPIESQERFSHGM